MTKRIEELQARRDALTGKRHDLSFYGGWHVIDNHTSKATAVDTFEDAILLAESRNETHEIARD